MGRLSLGPTARSVRAAIAMALTVLLSPDILPAQTGGASLSPDPLAADLEVDQGERQNILDLDIDQLARVDVVVPAMDFKVTSVAKHEGTVRRSPAAIYVITGEMIRRSGATSIPDLLRMVPGLEVGRIEADSWAITTRGFNAYFGNNLLVLIDGRSVYNPEFSGVHSDVQDLQLEDVERIEVIRGPGGTLWGANAVNWVINIITKRAKDTQGALITYGGGSQDLALGGVRYGGSTGHGLYWRAHGKHFERGAGFDPDGYRQVADELVGDGFALSYSPQRRTRDLHSGFVQDEITLADDRLYQTLGSKSEHNDFTGFEYRPSAGLLWIPDQRHSAWAAISRGVRTPARIDHDARYTLPYQTVPLSAFPRPFGDADFRSEQLVAYKIGYRTQASNRFAWDLTTFLNVYEGLESLQRGTPFAEGANLIVPMVCGNGMRGQTYGLELAGQWAVPDAWGLSASYSYLQIQLHTAAGYEAATATLYEGSSPHNQVRLQSSWDIARCWQFDLAMRYVDNLPAVHVHSYITMDACLARAPSDSFELSLVGQNLLEGHHLEFDPNRYSARPTEVQRRVCQGHLAILTEKVETNETQVLPIPQRATD